MSAIHNAEAIFDLPVPPHTLGLPVPNPTHSFWINLPGANPLGKEGSQDDVTPDADICIIGSGITGVSAAYHLARNLPTTDCVPSKVVILEARDFCKAFIKCSHSHVLALTGYLGSGATGLSQSFEGN